MVKVSNGAKISLCHAPMNLTDTIISTRCIDDRPGNNCAKFGKDGRRWLTISCQLKQNVDDAQSSR